tara:strand:+ start:5931 stop:6803 length:873 start_codon:yes stop_codon:yes gene_type:complete
MKFVIVCDGGLGNRLNSLYSGLVLCGSKKIEPTVYWPINEYCGLSVEECVDNFNLPQFFTLEGLEKSEGVINLSHDARKFITSSFIDINCIFSANSIHVCADSIYLYSSPLIPFFVKKTSLIKVRSEYPLTKRHEYNDFLKKEAVGLHLRGTDYGFHQAYFFFFVFIVKLSPFVKYRLFTDDGWVIKLFSNINNVSIEEQMYLPKKKFLDRDWHDTTGTFDYNIVRKEDSVKEAVNEMHALSGTFKLFTSRSTFLFHSYLIDNESFGFHIYFYFNRFVSLLRLVKKRALS